MEGGKRGLEAFLGGESSGLRDSRGQNYEGLDVLGGLGWGAGAGGGGGGGGTGAQSSALRSDDLPGLVGFQGKKREPLPAGLLGKHRSGMAAARSQDREDPLAQLREMLSNDGVSGSAINSRGGEAADQYAQVLLQNSLAMPGTSNNAIGDIVNPFPQPQISQSAPMNQNTNSSGGRNLIITEGSLNSDAMSSGSAKHSVSSRGGSRGGRPPSTGGRTPRPSKAGTPLSRREEERQQADSVLAVQQSRREQSQNQQALADQLKSNASPPPRVRQQHRDLLDMGMQPQQQPPQNAPTMQHLLQQQSGLDPQLQSLFNPTETHPPSQAPNALSPQGSAPHHPGPKVAKTMEAEWLNQLGLSLPPSSEKLKPDPEVSKEDDQSQFFQQLLGLDVEQTRVAATKRHGSIQAATNAVNAISANLARQRRPSGKVQQPQWVAQRQRQQQQQQQSTAMDRSSVESEMAMLLRGDGPAGPGTLSDKDRSVEQDPLSALLSEGGLGPQRAGSNAFGFSSGAAGNDHRGFPPPPTTADFLSQQEQGQRSNRPTGRTDQRLQQIQAHVTQATRQQPQKQLPQPRQNLQQQARIGVPGQSEREEQGSHFLGGEGSMQPRLPRQIMAQLQQQLSEADFKKLLKEQQLGASKDRMVQEHDRQQSRPPQDQQPQQRHGTQQQRLLQDQRYEETNRRQSPASRQQDADFMQRQEMIATQATHSPSQRLKSRQQQQQQQKPHLQYHTPTQFLPQRPLAGSQDGRQQQQHLGDDTDALMRSELNKQLLQQQVQGDGRTMATQPPRKAARNLDSLQPGDLLQDLGTHAPAATPQIDPQQFFADLDQFSHSKPSPAPAPVKAVEGGLMETPESGSVMRGEASVNASEVKSGSSEVDLENEETRAKTLTLVAKVPWFSQRLLAKLSGVSQSVVSNWIRGRLSLRSDKAKVVFLTMKKVLAVLFPAMTSGTACETQEDFEMSHNVNLEQLVADVAAGKAGEQSVLAAGAGYSGRSHSMPGGGTAVGSGKVARASVGPTESIQHEPMDQDTGGRSSLAGELQAKFNAAPQAGLLVKDKVGAGSGAGTGIRTGATSARQNLLKAQSATDHFLELQTFFGDGPEKAAAATAGGMKVSMLDRMLGGIPFPASDERGEAHGAGHEVHEAKTGALHGKAVDRSPDGRPTSAGARRSDVHLPRRIDKALLELSDLSDLTPEIAVERAYRSYVEANWTKAEEFVEPMYLPLHIELDVDSAPAPKENELTKRGRRLETVMWNVMEERDPADMARVICEGPAVVSGQVKVVERQLRQQLAKAGVVVPYSHKADKEGQSLADNRRRVSIRVRVENNDGGMSLLCDEFDWDLASSNNSPETFAQILCADLGLNIRNVVPIAKAIRMELVNIEGALAAADGDEDSPDEPLPRLESGLRVTTEADRVAAKKAAAETAKELVEGLLDDAFERYTFERDIEEEDRFRQIEEEEERVAKEWSKLKAKSKGPAVTRLGNVKKPMLWVPRTSNSGVVVPIDQVIVSAMAFPDGHPGSRTDGGAPLGGAAGMDPSAKPVKKRKRGRPPKVRPPPPQPVVTAEALRAASASNMLTVVGLEPLKKQGEKMPELEATTTEQPTKTPGSFPASNQPAGKIAEGPSHTEEKVAKTSALIQKPINPALEEGEMPEMSSIPGADVGGEHATSAEAEEMETDGVGGR